MADEQVVAVALVTQAQLDQLGSNLQRYWLIDDTPCFQGLLNAIDDAERDLWRSRDARETGSGDGHPKIVQVAPIR